MDHLGVELDADEAAVLARDGRERRVGRRGDGPEAGRQFGQPVAVAHPDRRVLGHASEERRLGVRHEGRSPELALVARLDAPAERVRDGLEAVADAEHRHRGARLGVPEAQQRRVHLRRAVVVHRARPAREDEPDRPLGCDLSHGRRAGVDLAVDAGLADAPRDELRRLAPEVQDDDCLMGHWGVGNGKWQTAV